MCIFGYELTATAPLAPLVAHEVRSNAQAYSDNDSFYYTFIFCVSLKKDRL